MNNCNCCYYHDAKENVCTHGSPIFIDDVCTDYQDSEFVMQIRADAIEECKVIFRKYMLTKDIEKLDELLEQLKDQKNEWINKSRID